jgi:hypothetical protein
VRCPVRTFTGISDVMTEECVVFANFFTFLGGGGGTVTAWSV